MYLKYKNIILLSIFFPSTLRTFKKGFKTSFSINNSLLNLCMSAVNFLRLFSSIKTDNKVIQISSYIPSKHDSNVFKSSIC